ncbi:MAG: spore germination protein GerW family protein [Thaumarchaeota archaeon]|nr:spore germination protein GerW family protein [Nitrososphaerota archaeon]
MSVIEQDVKTTVDELLKAISTKNVISDPIEVGDNVVITITKVGLGFGTGKGESKSASGPMGGGEGAGGAAGVSPMAIVVIHKSTPGPAGVEVKSLVPPSGIGKAIGDIATTVMQGMKEEKEKKNQEKTM